MRTTVTRDHTLQQRAHAMRRDPTEPEKMLWQHLSSAGLGGFKFRRQAVIEPWIVNFLCPAKALIVEVDGETHEAEADARRDANLQDRGYHTVQFINADVMHNIDGVLTNLLQALYETPDRWPRHHPNPSSEEEGLRNRPCSLDELPTASVTESPSSSEEGLGVVPSSSLPTR